MKILIYISEYTVTILNFKFLKISQTRATFFKAGMSSLLIIRRNNGICFN